MNVLRVKKVARVISTEIRGVSLKEPLSPQGRAVIEPADRTAVIAREHTQPITTFFLPRASIKPIVPLQEFS
mgnify:CR=1 FL=1